MGNCKSTIAFPDGSPLTSKMDQKRVIITRAENDDTLAMSEMSEDPFFQTTVFKETDQVKESEAERPVIFIGPFEHHSNELPWRESIATVVVIPEDDDGCPDLKVLEARLSEYKDRRVKIGSFCAGSNVTGICIDTKKYSRLLHKVRTNSRPIVD